MEDKRLELDKEQVRNVAKLRCIDLAVCMKILKPKEVVAAAKVFYNFLKEK